MSMTVFHDQERSRTYREADNWAVLTQGHQRISNLLKELSCSFGRDISVLDLGCGTGRHFHCVDQVKQLIGLDISLHMLRQARNPVCHDQITCQRIDLICGDVVEIAVVPGSFDFIYSIGMFLGHSSFGPSMCNRLFDLLSADGKMFVTLSDIGGRTGLATDSRLRQVMEQSRFARYDLSFFGSASTPAEYHFYGCVAAKDRSSASARQLGTARIARDVDDRPGDIIWRNVGAIMQEIATVIPAADTFILVDEDTLRHDLVTESRIVPFTERHDQYWGPPSDDDGAILELERLRDSGANFMVFAWPAFWWLEYYSGLTRHLRARFPCLLESELTVVFDLRAR
jgi:hypothetical protein